MNILEFVACTFSPQLPDGRYIFRPWGGKGPCYLLSAKQRAARAWIQLGFYLFALGALWFVPAFTATMMNLFVSGVAYVLLNHVLYWLFSIGLAKTDIPLSFTREERRAAMAAYSRSMGRPLLWAFLIVSSLFACAGLAIALLLNEWVIGLLCLGFFGGCAALFAWQLSLIGRPVDTGKSQR